MAGRETELLETPIVYLKGIGPNKAEILEKNLGIRTFGDLLHFFPSRYQDRSAYQTISEISENTPYVQIKGKIHSPELIGEGKKRRLRASLTDATGTIELVWFNQYYTILKILKPGSDYVVYGKPAFFRHTFSLTHPDIELLSDHKLDEKGFILPLYPVPEKVKNKFMDQRFFRTAMNQLLLQINTRLRETLPKSLLQKHRYPERNSALKEIHFPSSFETLNKAKSRLKYEELFYLQFDMLRSTHDQVRKNLGHRFEQIGGLFNTFYHQYLPYELTGAQKRVLKEIRQDVKTGYQMNRLLQGDVGSGKTVVALLSMLIALDNGFQACLMAPTEILARQHYEGLSELLKDMPVNISLLTGSVKAAERRKIHAALKDGSLHILIGTHALIEPTVEFKNLGIAIIDEQHRFGVEQRAKMWAKNNISPHILVMTATPIPRTLGMTLYGNLDQSVLDELPPGRKPIVTQHYYENDRAKVFYFIRQQIKAGRQIYFVYPLIDESETVGYKHLYEGFESVFSCFPTPEFQISIVHGRLKPEEKEQEMRRFVEGKTQIMLATTVIEVGVNVPNASVMIIENAERFGLSQLHQLRGRVGRGAEQSYCLLMTDKELGYEARRRIQTMVATQDGFKIAEVDFELRGPGDINGTAQSGFAGMTIANLVTDQALLQKAREDALALLETPQDFVEENNLVRYFSDLRLKDQRNFRSIS